MRVVTSEEMRNIDQTAINKYKFEESLIVENVGIRGAEWIEEEILSEHFQFGEIVVLVGGGNNGADGLAIARHLRNRGYSVRAFDLFPDDKKSVEIKKQLELAQAFGVKISQIAETESLSSYFTQTQDEYLVIDAIFGMGVRLPLSNYLFDVINITNSHKTVTVSIDIPTGVTGDTGTISGNAIEADVTLAIALPKTGHYIGEGAKHSGDIVVLDVGFPHELLTGGDKELLTPDSPYVLSIYDNRNKFAHKNTFGHTLVVGGSHGMTGAVMMASMAALKVGTGLVTASTWPECYPELTSRIAPEIMTGLIPTEKEGRENIKKQLERWDSIIVGPGMGRDERTRKTVLEVLNNYAGPVVVDADAINSLSLKEDAELLATRKFPTILTPHVGEFANFIGTPKDKVLERPLDYLKEAVDKCNCSIVMKGSCSYLGFPSGQFFINYFPNDGMASGGSGDVLAGLVGGLLAQNALDRTTSGMFVDKEQIYKSVCLAVAAHTLSGKHAVEKLGARAMTAGSLIEFLPNAFFDLESRRS